MEKQTREFARGEKTRLVREAFEEYANEHKNYIGVLRGRDINEAVEKKLGFKLNWKVSDFAKPESPKKRTHGNKELFVRTDKKGYYTIKK